MASSTHESTSTSTSDGVDEWEVATSSHRPVRARSEDVQLGAERNHVLMTTPFGGLYVIASEGKVVGIFHGHHEPPPGPVRLGRPLRAQDAAPEGDVSKSAATGRGVSAADVLVLERACQELAEYFDGLRREFSFPVGATGTTFQEDVWDALAEIPFGERRSYRDVAATLGNPAMGRAIGAAVRVNPLSIVIPGHRVVSSSGKVVGYAAGAGVKSALLDFERSVCAQPESTAAAAVQDLDRTSGRSSDENSDRRFDRTSDRLSDPASGHGSGTGSQPSSVPKTGYPRSWAADEPFRPH